jgi:hypothetical protein
LLGLWRGLGQDFGIFRHDRFSFDCQKIKMQPLVAALFGK